MPHGSERSRLADAGPTALKVEIDVHVPTLQDPSRSQTYIHAHWYWDHYCPKWRRIGYFPNASIVRLPTLRLQNGADAFTQGDFSMLGGVQLKLSAIRISGRYFVGLSDINDIDNQDKWKNQGFQVSLGLAL